MTKERKRQLDIDLWIILITSMLSLGLYIIFNNSINEIVYNVNINNVCSTT